MPYTVEKARQPAQPYVAVRTTIAFDAMSDEMGGLYARLFGWLEQQGIAPIGPPWLRSLCMTREYVEFEVAAPVQELAVGDEGVIAGALPACEVVRTTHVGPYDNLPEAYEAISAFMAESGLHAAGAPWEVYLTDPGAEPDPAKWETVVSFPVLPTEAG